LPFSILLQFFIKNSLVQCFCVWIQVKVFQRILQLSVNKELVCTHSKPILTKSLPRSDFLSSKVFFLRMELMLQLECWLKVYWRFMKHYSPSSKDTELYSCYNLFIFLIYYFEICCSHQDSFV
jgi:hypothetical protein